MCTATHVKCTCTLQRLTLYTASLGTVPATHFHKLCRNSRKGCHVVQYYGYSKSGIGSMFYNTNWMTLPYFLSSQETSFEMKMLKDFDVELLIGQISYQKNLIYTTFLRDMTPPLRHAQLWKQTKKPTSLLSMGKVLKVKLNNTCM